MQSHALRMARASGPETNRANRRLLAPGAVAAALLLLTSACSTDGTKSFACSASASIDNMFGTVSSDRAEDCGGTAGQAARTTGAKQAARPAGPQVDRASVRDLQARLKDLGYDPGPADGQLGPKTRAAIRAYQKDTGLKADGQVTASLLEQIKAE